MARADLVGDPAMTGQGPQRNGWFGASDAERIGPYQLIVNRNLAKSVDCFDFNYVTCSKRPSLFRRLRLWLFGR